MKKRVKKAIAKRLRERADEALREGPHQVPIIVQPAVAEPEEADSRQGARALGFRDLPGPQNDTMSDLTVGRHGGRGGSSVDSLSGTGAVGDAEALADWDTITDSNTLSSAATVAGAFDPHGLGRRAHDRDVASAETNEELETDSVREVSEATAPNLGMTDVPDDVTVNEYVNAERRERTQKRRAKGESHPD